MGRAWRRGTEKDQAVIQLCVPDSSALTVCHKHALLKGRAVGLLCVDGGHTGMAFCTR